MIWTPQLIRRIRKNLALTQQELADKLGVSFSTVNRWERGHSQPSPICGRLLTALAIQYQKQVQSGL